MRARLRHPGFSLMEVLMAIFILGIGVISIAAIFPAGIAQQRQASDEVMGPIVAENALAIIRTRVKPEHFGSYENFLPTFVSGSIPGDWGWRRPAFYPTDFNFTHNGNTVRVTKGAISIFTPVPPFAMTPTWAPADGIPGFRGIPWNPAVLGTANPAPFIITQRERYYPAGTVNGSGQASRPQYVWECMFRRFQGKILVAIFVYRVNLSGQPVSYAVAMAPGGTSPLPVSIDLVNTPGAPLPWHDQPWTRKGDESNAENANELDALITGTFPGDEYNPLDAQQGWQLAGQWLLDQNNNIHRVLNGRRSVSEGPVELARIIPGAPPAPVYYQPYDQVTNFWYIPPVDANGVSLTPVYVTVREL
jgi:prepilin-type N-terminal cleavage/methylation domain-containing protein